MTKLSLILIICLMISACGAPKKPKTDSIQPLIAALVAQDRNQINRLKSQASINIKNANVINLFVSAVNNKPYQLISSSQQLIKNYHHYNPAQQSLLKPLILWAYAHPIYRQETAKQVRLLQRTELLVAPSNINFNACENNTAGCANTLRQQIANIISTAELTNTLKQMATNDPCINLTDKNVGGEFGNQCLASRKGNLKINLLSSPQFLFGQWDAMLNSAPKAQ